MARYLQEWHMSRLFSSFLCSEAVGGAFNDPDRRVMDSAAVASPPLLESVAWLQFLEEKD